MPKTIRISMMEKDVNVNLSSDRLTLSTVKSAFLIPWDAVVRLSYEEEGCRYGCEVTENGLSFILPDNFSSLQFRVESNKPPSKPAVPAVEGTANKRQKIDPELETSRVDGDMVSRISQYAWFYTKEDEVKRSAMPLTKNLAVTYRHGDNKSLVVGDCITLSSYRNPQVVVDTCVVRIHDTFDFIVLQSKSAELCDRDLVMEAVEPKRGMKYTLMGYSVFHGKTSHISFSTGIISSDSTSTLRFLGSSRSANDDRGGSCWSDEGKLIGMQVDSSSPASSERLTIFPITKIHALILEFIPEEEEVDWSE